MKRSNPKKYVAFFAALSLALFSLISFSCKKKSAQAKTSSNIFDISLEDGQGPSSSYWRSSQKKICIVFGEGYNEKIYVQKILVPLFEKYGRDDGTPDSGLIFPLVYPDDFPSGRITRLSSIIDERELMGLITVAAPENTNRAVANLEDEWDTQEKLIPYPVYSFFPQDNEVAGIEATSNFVVDLAFEGSGTDDDESDREEVSQTQIKDLDLLLDRAIEYMLLTESPLPADEDLITHVSRIVGKNYSVSRFVDAESGLLSINHFVIEEKK